MLHNVPFVQTTSPESFRCFLVWYPGKSPLDIPFSPWSPQSWTLHSPSWDRWRWQPVQLLLIQSEWGQSLQFWGGRGHWGHSKLSNIPLEQKQLVQGSSLSVPINELGQNDWNLVSSFSISTLSSRKVMRLKKMINKGLLSQCITPFSKSKLKLAIREEMWFGHRRLWNINDKRGREERARDWGWLFLQIHATNLPSKPLICHNRGRQGLCRQQSHYPLPFLIPSRKFHAQNAILMRKVTRENIRWQFACSKHNVTEVQWSIVDCT